MAERANHSEEWAFLNLYQMKDHRKMSALIDISGKALEREREREREREYSGFAGFPKNFFKTRCSVRNEDRMPGLFCWVKRPDYEETGGDENEKDLEKTHNFFLGSTSRWCAFWGLTSGGLRKVK